MIALADMLNRAGYFWWIAMVRAVWQGGLALALVWVLVRLLPRLSPHVQCWLWRLAYLKLIVAFFWGTPLSLPLLSPPLTTPPAYGIASPSADYIPPDFQTYTLSPESVTNFRIMPAPGSASLLTPGGMLLALWVGTICWQIGRAGGEWRSARRLYRASRPISEPALLTACMEISQRLGLRCTPRLLAHKGNGSPLLQGLWKPAILLPEAVVTSYDAMQQRLVLAHELAHLRRRDLLWAWLPLLARTLFPFHPLIWLAQRELVTAQVMACDAVVLEITHAPVTDYGNLLIRIASQSGSHPTSELTGIGMAASFHTLKRRLFAMKTTTSLSPTRLALYGSSLFMLGVIGIVPWRVTAQTRPAVPPSPLLLTDPTVEKPEIASPADSPKVPTGTTVSSASLLKARAGDYTIYLEKTALVNSGINTEAHVMTLPGGAHYQPNLAVYLKVIGCRSDVSLLAGLSPQVAATDARGARAEPSPATLPTRLSSTTNMSQGVVYLRVPDTNVKNLRSLDGALLVYGGTQPKIDMSANELRAGLQKRLGAITVQIEAYQVRKNVVEATLAIVRPSPQPAPTASTQDRMRVAGTLGLDARSVRAEFRDAKGKVYAPMTFGSTLSGPQKAPTPSESAESTTRQTIQLSFVMPPGDSKPQSLTLILPSRTGDMQRLPFHFTKVPLPSAP